MPVNVAPYSTYPQSRVPTVAGIRALWVTAARYVARYYQQDGVIQAADFILTRWWPLVNQPVGGQIRVQANDVRPALTYDCTVTAIANDVRVERTELVARLRAAQRLTVLALDNNGRFWLIGQYGGLTATATSDWGEREGRNTLTLELSGSQPEHPMQVLPAVAQDWLLGDGGTYTPSAVELARLTSLDTGAPAVTPLCLPVNSGGAVVCPPVTADGRVYEVAVVSQTSVSVPATSHEFARVGNVIALTSGGQNVVMDWTVDGSENITITFSPAFTGKIRIMGGTV